MAPVRADVKFTVAEYRTLPETGPRFQLLDGELIVSPSPSFRHQQVVTRILVALYNFVVPRRLGIVCGAPLDVILSDENVSQPDIVHVSGARQAIVGADGLRGAPDLCVEVLSPATRDLDRGAKRLLYARFGVIEYWIVDPQANAVEVYRLQDNPSASSRTLSADDTLTTLLLPGWSVRLQDVFRP